MSEPILCQVPNLREKLDPGGGSLPACGLHDQRLLIRVRFYFYDPASPLPTNTWLSLNLLHFFWEFVFMMGFRGKKEKTGVSTKQRVQKVLRSIEIALSSPENYLGIITQYY